ncbi:MAG: SUMF1/EgtB/PvdO family nonheme iron enzyme [Candidatus Omnitrophota bacterium]
MSEKITGFIKRGGLVSGLILLIFLMSGGVFGQETTPRIWVVSVGVSKYVQAFQTLEQAAEGARDVAKALEKCQPSSTRTYILTTDSPDETFQPTRGNIAKILGKLSQQVSLNDLVIFYFSGHGVDIEGQQLLLMKDADLIDKDTRDVTTIPLTYLRDKLEGLPCQGRLLWLDACRETVESLSKKAGISDVMMSKDFLTNGGGWSIQEGRVSATLFSCREGQKSYYGKEGSFFNRALVEGLSGKAADPMGQVTLSSLVSYIQGRVPVLLKEEKGGEFQQQPVILPGVPEVILSPAPPAYIACPPFSGEKYGDLFAETLQTQLAKSRAVNLVERIQLDKALNEIKLKISGITEDALNLEAGKMVGAKYVLIGSSKTAPGNQLCVNVRLVEVKTGKQISGVAGKCTFNPEDKDEWEAALNNLSGELLAGMQGEVIPEETRRASLPVSKKSTGKKEITIDLGKGITMEMVLIPPGEFLMGSPEGEGGNDEHPQHKVKITKSFYLGKYEVTQEQWEAVMGNNPSNFKGVKNPVEQVSYDVCQDFLRGLNRLFPGKNFRLPTEAEWEYAARGTDSRRYPWGDTWDRTRLNSASKWAGMDIMNNDDWNKYYYKSGKGEAFKNSRTESVGSYENGTSPFGLYDMAGNVWEWCRDWYDANYYQNSPTEDPEGPPTGSFRVLRGGSWGIDANYCRPASRDWIAPTNWLSLDGFRCASSP